jgi:hypothetical protein
MMNERITGRTIDPLMAEAVRTQARATHQIRVSQIYVSQMTICQTLISQTFADSVRAACAAGHAVRSASSA